MRTSDQLTTTQRERPLQPPDLRPTITHQPFSCGPRRYSTSVTSPASSARPGRQRSVTRSGIVLRRWKTPRGDLIVSLLTPQGKLKAIARGGLRGKHASPLNLFHHVELQVYSRPGDDLAVIQQASLEGALSRLALPERHPYAHLLAELAELLFQEGETDEYGPQAFDLFAGGLRGVAGHADPEWVTLVISYKLLALAGFPPRTRVCVRCGAPDPQHPDPFGGELLCGRCSHQRALSPSTLDFLRNVVRRSVRQNMDSPVPPGERRALWQGLERFVGVQVGKVRSWPQLYTQP
ncbi:DNA repair protein RecO [Deinococcus radiophilus]|uniref:DNA repair protein RecO n=1 Tax=Deinococcus radiophilus TaxID=32062 RepID=A0A431W469_9DEIO|nr:DNA repair protein RecO [Deinococcus radiophilus]